MKKKVRLLISALLVGVFVLVAFSGCSTITGNGKGNANGNGSGSDYASESTANLSSSEVEGLLYMVEEEKLARDVYTYLNDLWRTQLFDNIAQSEQTHMDAVLSLISKHNLEIPITSDSMGEFTDANLKSLYEQLITTGAKSEVDALKVGATIEEIDIIDLDEYTKVSTSQDILNVYENLKSGSESHLRAFVSQLEKYGITYTPQYLSVQEYDAIISGSNNGQQGNTGSQASGNSNASGNNGKNGNGGNGNGGN